MKKTIIISALLAGSFSAFSQGTVNYADRLSDMTIHIFAPQVATPGTEITGNQAGGGGVTADIYYNNGTDANIGSAGANSGGSTVYTGGAIGNTLTSSPTAAGAYNYNNGSDYTVELYAAPGLNAAASTLLPVSQYVTTIVNNSASGGTFKSLASSTSDPGIGGVTAGGPVTIALVAWYNGGTGLTLAQDQNPNTAAPWGESLLVNLASTGGGGSPPAVGVDMQGLQSFSLIVPTPEPSTIALGVIGVSTLLFRRRK